MNGQESTTISPSAVAWASNCAHETRSWPVVRNYWIGRLNPRVVVA